MRINDLQSDPDFQNCTQKQVKTQRNDDFKHKEVAADFFPLQTRPAYSS